MKKRIFYYSNHREDDPSIGITKKVHAQIYEMRKEYEVFFSAYYKNGIGIFDNDNKLIKFKSYLKLSDKLNHFTRRIVNLVFVRKYIHLDKIGFSFIYMRFHYWDWFSFRLIKEIKKKNIKLIVEAHSYPYKKGNIGGAVKILYWLDDLYSRKVRLYVDLVVAVTNVKDKIWGCHTIQIENGINLVENRRRDVVKKQENYVQLLCVTNESVSHGIDRVLYGLANYYKKNWIINVELYLVGEYTKATKRLVEELKLTNYVMFVGKKFGEELYKYYERADLGLGLLAGYRQGYHEGSCLKTKEYFAVGLPFITSADKKAKINRFSYVYVVPEDDSAIEINDLIEFNNSLTDKEEIADEMHTYALEHYSWEREMNKIFKEIYNYEI